jgi:hypothetical protein
MGVVVIIDYTNHAGVREKRRIIPMRMIYEKNNHHKEIQWFCWAVALDRNNATRMFAMRDIHSWEPESHET